MSYMMLPKNKIIYQLSVLTILLFSPLTYSQTAAPSAKTEASSKLFGGANNTDSEYLMAIEKAGEVVQSAYNDADFETSTFHLFAEIDRTQQKLNLILTNLKGANPNVRNQQMYRIVLQEIRQELDEQNNAINLRNKNLDKIKDRFTDLRKDKALITLLKDTILRKQFKNEFLNLKKSYLSTDSLMNHNLEVLNTKNRLTVQRKIAVSSALLTVEKKLEKSGISILGREYPFLWKTSDTIAKKDISKNIKGKVAIENSVVSYYLN